jgi:Tol biopolymer transport system component
VVAVLLATLLVAAATVQGAGPGGGSGPDTVLVSRAGLKGKGGDGNSIDPSISADGRYVAFASRAGNLVPGTKAGRLEIYVKDVKTGKVTLASRAGGAGGTIAEFNAYEPSISADGRYVAFGANSKNLGEGNGESQVYVRDLVANTTTLVSRASGPGGAIADGSSRETSISADGRKVAFVSSAHNLAAGLPAQSENVFVRDLDSGVTELVSRGNGAEGAPSEFSTEPSISAEGRYVAFSSRSPLSSDDVDLENFPEDIFVRDRAAATTTLVSRANGPTGKPSEVESSEPAISADGDHVAFASDAPLTGKRSLDRNVFVRDVAAGTTQLVSVGEERSEGTFRRRPSVSADGRYVAFQSGGDKLSPVDAEGRVDVFVRDMQKGLTVTVSRSSGSLGLPGDGPSFNPAITPDGSVVAFDSRATNFSGADGDRFSDVFLRRPVYAPEPKLPECHGRAATLVGTNGADVLKGTERKDVVLTLGGDDHIKTFDDGDIVCAGPGADVVDAGENGETGGSDLVLGGPGNDKIKLGRELGTAKGGAGNDVLIGSKGGDALYGGSGNDVLYGGPNPTYNSDFLYGGPGNDKLYGGPGPNYVKGGPGRDVEVGGNRE